MTERSSNAGLHLKGLTKRFGGFHAVNSIDLDIKSGEFLTLLGPSGSGKTTLLMMIAGFQDVTSGDIALGNKSIVNLAPEKRNFGMVFQGYALFPHMTVAENIGYSLSVRGRTKADIRKCVGDMLDLVQLQGMDRRFPAQLSGGQQQRVALARALCFSPPILLLDEPLGALDKKLRIEVQAQLKELHRTVGTTFIYVTHDQEEALSMSDRVVIMQSGSIEQVGTPQHLYTQPRTAFCATFLGRSNILRRGGNSYAIRPERIGIAHEQAGPQGVSGTVQSVTYFGTVLKYIVDTSEYGKLEVDVDAWRAETVLPVDAAVVLHWPDSAMVLLQ